MAASWLARCSRLVAQVVASALWLHAWGRVVPPGWRRLLTAVPPVLLFVAAPTYWFAWPDECVSIAISGFITGWLSSFKTLAWVLGRGPLAAPARRWSPAQFVVLLLLPIVPAAEPELQWQQLPVPAKAAHNGVAENGAAENGGIDTAPGGRGGAPKARRRSARLAAAQQAQHASGEPAAGGEGAGAGHRTVLESASSSGSAALLARWALKLAANAGVVFLLTVEGIPAPLRTLLYVVALYSMLGVMMDGPASLALSLLGMKLAPHFRPPWLSPSIAGFWGLHWNQAAGNSLRTFVYDPIVQGRLLGPPAPPAVAGADGGGGAPRPSRRRQLAGMSAAFAVSGVVHEVIVWASMRCLTPRLAWLAFFCIQPALILGERAAAAGVARALGRPPPAAARAAAGQAALLLVGHWLFFRPVEQIGMVDAFAFGMRRGFAGLATAAAAPAHALAAWAA
eukprot:scaffold12.g8212.t1